LSRINGAGVLGQLIDAGLGNYIILGSVRIDGHGVRGVFDLAVLNVLRSHPDFQEGIWHLLHDVGERPTEFRSYNGALGKGSLQIAMSQVTGEFEADVDRYNTQDVVNIFGHLFGEVVPNKLRQWFRRA
jgi:hypothetical protein